MGEFKQLKSETLEGLRQLIRLAISKDRDKIKKIIRAVIFTANDVSAEQKQLARELVEKWYERLFSKMTLVSGEESQDELNRYQVEVISKPDSKMKIIEHNCFTWKFPAIKTGSEVGKETVLLCARMILNSLSMPDKSRSLYYVEIVHVYRSSHLQGCVVQFNLYSR